MCIRDRGFTIPKDGFRRSVNMTPVAAVGIIFGTIYAVLTTDQPFGFLRKTSAIKSPSST